MAGSSSQPYQAFAFHSPQGTLTARREHRYATVYWYAYRCREGHLFNICSKLNVRGCTQAIAKVRTLGKDVG